MGKALKGEATVNYASPLTRPPRLSGSRWRAGNAAYGRLRLARRVKSNEINMNLLLEYNLYDIQSVWAN
jgi:hypothetical protein